MDLLETTSETVISKNSGFIEHVFYLNDATKNDLMNLLQYVLLGVMPIIIINKIIQNFVPEFDEEKDSIQITLECVLQIITIFGAMFFINRIITFIPTYSKQPYGDINLIGSGLAFLIIVLGLQTKLGEKVELLYSRMYNYWVGEIEPEEKPKAKNIISSSHQTSRADNLGMSSLPQNSTPMPPTMPTQQQTQQQTMTQQAQTSLQQQTQPQMNYDSMYQEPMAANEGFSGFGSSW